MRYVFQLAALILISTAGQAQILYTTPGNGVSMRVIIYNPTNGQPCRTCPLTWQTVSIDSAGAQTGYHYHSPIGAPQGTITRSDPVTDANGYGTALWTSKLGLDVAGYPTGYAMAYNVRVCSTAAQNVCVTQKIQALYAGLSSVGATTGWYKTTDSNHNNQQYAATFFFTQEVPVIASKYYSSNGHKTFMVVRISLPLGGIYDGWLGQAFWKPDYRNTTGGGGEDENHMKGDEMDISAVGMSMTDLAKLATAVTSTKGSNGISTCEFWPGTGGLAHVYCP